MSRLTERYFDGEVGVAECGNKCKYGFRYYEDCAENCPTFKEIYEKLAHYKDLEEQGRLIEQKHGQWIHKDNFIGKYLMCSECSHVTGRKSNYCPDCGAKMDEVSNE